MQLSKLIDLDALDQAVAEGYIKRQFHPTEPLTIFNYTPKAQYEQHWTPGILACRGLVVDSDLEVVARPFEKFHNLDPENLPPLDAEVLAFDKMDGSLGIIFYYHGRWHIATRGSFESEQAKWADAKLQSHYRHALGLRTVTYLVEIIYPGNRIVCDYGDREDLVLLGARETASGRFVAPQLLPWFGERAEVLHRGTLESVLALPPREGAEGLVLHVDDYGMWKLKQEDYVALHRLVFGLNARRCWECAAVTDLRAMGLEPVEIGRRLRLDPLDVERIFERFPDRYWADALERELPEEFHGWLRDLDAQFQYEFSQILERATRLFTDTMLKTPSRKEFAKIVRGSRYAHICFALADNKFWADQIWKAIQPEPTPMLAANEEDL